MRQNTNPDDLRQYLCKSCDRTGWIYTNEKGERIEFANGLHDKVTDSAFSSIEALSKQQASQVIESLQS